MSVSIVNAWLFSSSSNSTILSGVTISGFSSRYSLTAFLTSSMFKEPPIFFDTSSIFFSNLVSLTVTSSNFSPTIFASAAIPSVFRAASTSTRKLSRSFIRVCSVILLFEFLFLSRIIISSSAFGARLTGYSDHRPIFILLSHNEAHIGYL